MIGLLLTVLQILIAIGIIALIYFLIIWALGQFGVPVPEKPMKIAKIALVIVVLIVIYMIVAGTFHADIPITLRR